MEQEVISSMKIEISETLYRTMYSVMVGLQHSKESTRHQNAVRRGRQLARRLPSIETLKELKVINEKHEKGNV